MKNWVVLLSFLALPAVVSLSGCLQEYPFHTPQGSSNHGPTGGFAFLTGEGTSGAFTAGNATDVRASETSAVDVGNDTGQNKDTTFSFFDIGF